MSNDVVTHGPIIDTADDIRPLTAPKMAAVCRAMMRGTQPLYRYSDEEIASCATKHRDAINQAFRLTGRMPVAIIAAVAKAILWYGYEKIEPFCRRLRDVNFNEENDPAKALYIYMMKPAYQKKDGQMYRKAVSAIRYEVDNRPCYKLFDAQEDFFPWVGGWSVPPKEE
jgi:hypothetical protein